MKVFTLNTKEEVGKSAADYAAGKIRQAIRNKGFANIILATGASQFETLKNLVSAQNSVFCALSKSFMALGALPAAK